MNKSSRFQNLIRRIEQATIVLAIRGGLVAMIPVLTIGAFALILNTLPVQFYQNAIGHTFLPELFTWVFNATFGVLALYMTFSISHAYIRLKADPDTDNIGAQAVSLLSFFILAGVYQPDFGTDSMGPKSVSLAIITGIGASYLYLKLLHVFKRFRTRRLLSAGADREFNAMLATILPIAVTALLFTAFNLLITHLFDVDSFRHLLSRMFNALFSYGKNGFFKGFFFVLLSSVLWFFGIHGSDTLEGVMQTYFTPGLEQNQAALEAGLKPDTILTKEFFDCFVLMGGCGTTICLLISILLFSRNKAQRGLGVTAAFPMIFNINELMVFGLPIIFNPTMLVPFLLVPLVCYTTSYVAVAVGLVPVITSNVEWTTPILLGGLRATDSAAGMLLQLVNVTIGVLIYLPFVRLQDKKAEESSKDNYHSFVDFFKHNEALLAGTKLIELNNIYGEFAKSLCADLRHELKEGIRMAYQPQYHYDGRCVGVEALLRWKHPVHGILYPPLVVKLAEDGGFLPELEEAVITTTLRDKPKVLERFGKDTKISFNVTGTTVVTPRFLQFCTQQNQKTPFKDSHLCVEVTEQSALSINDETLQALKTIKDMGFLLAVDDFSMGQTSLHYLRHNMFDIIKLDGMLVRGLFEHQNCREIISSVTQLAESLNLHVYAEFVETEEQREVLHEIGCDYYQGYLYSPAVFLDN